MTKFPSESPGIFNVGLRAATLLCALLTLHCGDADPAAPKIATAPAQLSLSPSNPQIAQGTALQFSVSGLFTTGHHRDLTQAVHLSVSAPDGSRLPMAQDGLLQLEQPGRYQVTAEYLGRAVATTLTVTSAKLTALRLSPTSPRLPKGLSLAFTATASFSDGTTQNVSGSATWSAKDLVGSGVVSLNSKGVATAKNLGQASITAYYKTLSASAALQVTAASLAALALSPQNPTLVTGGSLTFSAHGKYSDGSVQDVTAAGKWGVTDRVGSGVASLVGSTLTADSAGQATVSVFYQGLAADTILTVTDVRLVSLALTPLNPSVKKGATQQFTATGSYSDGTTQDLTGLVSWTATDIAPGMGVATIDASGLATGNQAGQARITASYLGLTASTTLYGGCQGRQCQINYNCPVAKGPTTITGVVTIPAGTLPINNALVYIPSDVVPAPFTSGASCNRCDSAVPVDAAVSTTTDINGKFTLNDVPSGANIPIVISVGKWRRVVTIPGVTDCTKTTLAADQTRLPRNQTEGNIPKIALSTGRADAMECMLRSNKLGLDDSEFTNATGRGRVNLYAGGIYAAGTANHQGTSAYAPALGGAAFTVSNGWWDSLTNLSAYDIVMMSCESAQDVSTKSASALNAMQRYLNAGGRVFASHYHNYWISGNTAPLNTVATFVVGTPGAPGIGGYQNDVTIDTAIINQSFAKGAALANWLQSPAVAATNTLGRLPITASRVTLTGRNAALTTDWADFSAPTLKDGIISPASQYFSFKAPVGASAADQCGEMVFTDMHVTGTVGTDQSGPLYPFPTGCTSTGLTPQEKALIFLLFELSSCLNPT